MKASLKVKFLSGVLFTSMMLGCVSVQNVGAMVSDQDVGAMVSDQDVDPDGPLIKLYKRMSPVMEKYEMDTRSKELKMFFFNIIRDFPYLPSEVRPELVNGYINDAIKPSLSDPFSVAIYAAMMDKSELETREMFQRDGHM